MLPRHLTPVPSIPPATEFALTSANSEERNDLAAGERRELSGTYGVADSNDIAGEVQDVDAWLEPWYGYRNLRILAVKR